MQMESLSIHSLASVVLFLSKLCCHFKNSESLTNDVTILGLMRSLENNLLYSIYILVCVVYILRGEILVGFPLNAPCIET